MEIFFYGIGIFCLFASIGANFYFLYLVKLVYGTLLDTNIEIGSIKYSVQNEIYPELTYQCTRISSLQEELEEFKNESMIIEKDSCKSLKDFVETINVLNNKIEDYHEDVKKKMTTEVRKNNWDSVREAFTRSHPKIQLQERN